jgi:O-antigen/teichoic acid export membrane protein
MKKCSPFQWSKNLGKRDAGILRQTVLGIILRFIAILTTFLALPIMLNRLGSADLGVWLVLLSVFQWITFFDLGVGAGARNEMARAFSAGENYRIRQSIATGFYYTTFITAVLVIICIAVGALTPAIFLLENSAFDGRGASVAIWIVALGSCGAFVLNYIQTVYAAQQRASAISYFAAMSSLIFLVLIFCWPDLNLDNLTLISTLYLTSMVVANISLMIWFFWGRWDLLPSAKDVNPEMRNRILGFGIRIFIIQIAAMIVFTTSRVLASIFLGPEEVVIYDAAFKLFALITMVHALIMSTLWSSFTEAHILRDWIWLHNRVRYLQIFTVALIPVSIALAFGSPWIIRSWLTNDQVGTSGLYISFAILTFVIVWNNVFAYFLNGIGDTKVQLKTSLLALVFHFPSCYFFTKIMGWGLVGINLGIIVSLSFFAIAGPISVRKLLKQGLLAMKSLPESGVDACN